MIAHVRGSTRAGESDEDADNSFTELVEKLDATVFGLIEALDSDAADLPRLLDEALNGSLWARKIARSADELAAGHRAVLNTRVQLIWRHTTPALRRGHFAMGVGLDSGLAIDAMADQLAALIDKADAAALAGDAEKLGDALAGAAAQLLTIRPFEPDGGLGAGWENTLRAWVSGVGVDMIGPQSMKLVEDAFTYRLVWGLEAIRTRRMVAGWETEAVAGGGAAAAETGVPSLMMAVLIRAGLASRKAAIARSRAPNLLSPTLQDCGLGSSAMTSKIAPPSRLAHGGNGCLVATFSG